MSVRRSRRPLVAMAGVAAAALAVAGCADDPATGTGDGAPPATSATATGAVTSTGTATPAGLPAVPGLRTGRTIATGLDVPWGLTFLPDGSALVAERESGRVLRVAASGGTTPVGTVPGVRAAGEGGLLGLAVPPPAATGGRTVVLAYLTSTAGDNRVVRIPFENGRLGRPDPVLTGIPAAGNHNGGRIVVGPDGRLWIGTGDAGDRALSQDRSSLGGKILRIGLDGSVPPDNPFPGSPVWSYGHRNVQGLAFDAAGQLWATEFGQNRWDELNRVVKGADHGWPDVEGRGSGGGRTVEPAAVWPTSDASPSGLAIVGGVAYMAALRGERVWQIPLAPGGGSPAAGTAVARFTGDYGRIRTIEPAPGGGLWMTTSNRDGRGSPGRDDDRILELLPAN